MVSLVSVRLVGQSYSNTCGDIVEEQELLLLGCVTRRWTHLIEGIMSVSYKSITVLEQYEELCKLLLQRSKSLKQNEIVLNSKVIILQQFLEILICNITFAICKPGF